MSRLALGALCGLVWGVLTVVSMLPLAFPDKNAALTGAFFNRFAIGAVLGAVIGSPQVTPLNIPPWLVGVVVALLISASDAIVTKAYGPVLALGALGGAVVGLIIGRWGA